MTATTLDVSFRCSPVREIHVTDRPLGEAVVQAVADLEGVDPMALPSLHDSVEPDALDQLVSHRSSDSNATLAVMFTYAGWNVFVRGDGTVVVGDPDRMSEPTPLF